MSERRTLIPEYHVGRSFSGHHIEDACPCEKEPCGLVSWRGIDPSCEQHKVTKTIRQSHLASECPGGDGSQRADGLAASPSADDDVGGEA